MAFDPKAADFLVAVVGTGSMGRGIMQVAAQGGMRVLAFDEKPEAAKAAMAHVAKMIETQVAKGRLGADAGQAGLDRIGLARAPSPRPTSSSKPSSSGSTSNRRCLPGSTP